MLDCAGNNEVSMDYVITVDKLVKKYPTVVAVNDISFQVERGEIFGLLGENGAGKTTALEIIEGLRKPTEGTVTVLGIDVRKNPAAMKSKIGVQLQSSSYYHFLTLREILILFASFYGKKIDPLALLDRVHLREKANSYAAQLSGGQRQRFSIVASLVNDPEIVFLDEPTTGLDPLARRNLWAIIEDIRAQGKTVVMTTHYMEEAELLCDRIAIMDDGKIIAQDKTSRLLQQASYPYTVVFEPTKNEKTVVAKLEKLGELIRRPGKANQFEIRLKKGVSTDTAFDLVQSTDPEGLTIRPSSLEDLFIELTGRSIKSEEEHA